jgi:rubrerythrin
MATAPRSMPADAKRDVARWLENRQEEIDSAFQYVAMADGEQRANVADVYRRLAAMEEKHAAFWERHLREAGPRAGPAPAERASTDPRMAGETPRHRLDPPHHRGRRVRGTQ